MASEHIQATLSVQNVTESVAFYHDVLGFDFQGFWDPEKNEATPEWTRDEQPPYAVGRSACGVCAVRYFGCHGWISAQPAHRRS